jgi:hypothetical protein
MKYIFITPVGAEDFPPASNHSINNSNEMII